MGVGYGARERIRATPQKNASQTRLSGAQPGRPKNFPEFHSVRAILNLFHKIPRSIISDLLVIGIGLPKKASIKILKKGHRT